MNRTDATLFFLSSQVSAVIYFFLSRNIRIARERAYEQTIQSRGKGADWWQPYVEEWDNPPRVQPSRWKLSFFMGGPVGRIVAKGESSPQSNCIAHSFWMLSGCAMLW